MVGGCVMTTQQDIVNRINALTLYYNVAWPDIKDAADRAIREINRRLGARYPNMSDVLLSPESTYTFNSAGVNTPYFNDGYIQDVIVPYIAMEVLAKDQEFTTVYQKYAQDFDNALFAMFQEEFNRVPLAFRQSSDVGVFFGADTAAEKIALKVEEQLPVFKYRVFYHINNDAIVFKGDTKFVEDLYMYDYEDTYTVKGWNIRLLSADGATAYTFNGWKRNANEVIADVIEPGYEGTITEDIHYYADWLTESTLTCALDGTVYIKNDFIGSLTNLEIPSIVNNIMVRSIPSNFLYKRDYTTNPATVTVFGASVLESITLPPYLTEIQNAGFKGFLGTEIDLPETIMDIVSNTYAGIRIETNAFQDTPNLIGIVLPTNVHTIQYNAFPPVSNKTLSIKCRLLKQNKPIYDPGEIETEDPLTYVEGTDTGWNNSWYTLGGSNYEVVVTWGYNG